MNTPLNIPFVEVAHSYLELKTEIDLAIERVLRGRQYIRGLELEAFEAEFAEYCGVRYCVGVSNGLDAINLVLRALEIGSNDEVIVPSFAFSWQTFNLELGLGYGNFNVPGVNFMINRRTLIPTLDMYWTF